MELLEQQEQVEVDGSVVAEQVALEDQYQSHSLAFLQ
jgi:hypothetical protein